MQQHFLTFCQQDTSSIYRLSGPLVLILAYSRLSAARGSLGVRATKRKNSSRDHFCLPPLGIRHPGRLDDPLLPPFQLYLHFNSSHFSHFIIDDRITNTLVQPIIPFNLYFLQLKLLGSRTALATSTISMFGRQRQARFDHPPLTPSLCFNTRVLKGFTRNS